MSKKTGKNIGIVLSGGGAKGAFEVGAIRAIQNWCKRNKHNIVAVSGTSIGSFNGAFLAAGQFDYIEKTWLEWDNNSPITEKDFYGEWISLLINGCMYPTEPLRKFLRKNLVVDALKTGNIDYLNTRVRLKDGELLFGGNIDKREKPDYVYAEEILASMAFLPARKEVNVLGELCADGGFRECVPVKPLLDNTTKELDEIFVVLVDPPERLWKYKDVNRMNALERFQWSHMDILWTETVYNDVKLGQLHWNNDDKFHVIQPTAEKLKSDVGSFDKSSIHNLYKHGIHITKDYIKNMNK